MYNSCVIGRSNFVSRRVVRRPKFFIETIAWERLFRMLGEALYRPFVNMLSILFIISVVMGVGYVIGNGISSLNKKYELRQQIKIEAEKKAEQDRIEHNLYIESERIKKEAQLKEQQERYNSLCKTYKKDARIKINDMNRLVPLSDGGSRFSVGAIDTVDRIEANGNFIIGASGEKWAIETVELVRSSREWRDLVKMENRGELKFYGEDEEEVY